LVLALAHSSSSGGAPVYTGVQPTFNGVNLTQAGTLIVNGAAHWMLATMWYLLEASIPAGAQTMVASWSSGTNNMNEADALATVFTLSGVNQTSPVSGTDSGTTNSATTIAGAGLAATTGGLVIFSGAFNAGSAVGVTGPSGYTLDLTTTAFDFSGYAMQGHKAIASAGTETPSISWTAAAGAVILTANFQAVAGTPSSYFLGNDNYF
jgi:hypothetical protein